MPYLIDSDRLRVEEDRFDLSLVALADVVCSIYDGLPPGGVGSEGIPNEGTATYHPWQMNET
jgi:hypothetical protein